MAIPNIPGFTVVEKIREGATATSWKAVQTSLKRPVVLKILNTEGTAEDQAKVEGILSQMRKVASLKHAGFFELIDIGERDGMYYVVMGGSDGRTLADLLAEKFRLPEKDILPIATALAEALDYAWTTKGLYHGNIKPDNIVMHPDGSTLIADMGMARVETHFDQATGRTHEMIVGTPNYMSPEQVQGRGGLDCRTDIYSLGATLYQVATGIIPFVDSSGEDVMQKHLIDSLPNPRDINPDVSPALAGIIVKMMVKNQDNRYLTWSEVIEDLSRAKANRLQAPQFDATALSTVRASVSQSPQPAPAQPLKSAKSLKVSQPMSVLRTAAPAQSSAAAPVQQRRQKKSGIQVLLQLVSWLVIAGVWIYLTCILLWPPPAV